MTTTNYLQLMSPLRCCMPGEFLQEGFCPYRPAWMMPGQSWDRPGLFCERHRPFAAVPLSGDVAVRRLELRTAIYFASIKGSSAAAQQEALHTLISLVERAGGLVNLVDSSSVMGLWRVPALSASQHGQTGKGSG